MRGLARAQLAPQAMVKMGFQFARPDVEFSNSMTEALFRSLKHRWLFILSLTTFEAVCRGRPKCPWTSTSPITTIESLTTRLEARCQSKFSSEHGLRSRNYCSQRLQPQQLFRESSSIALRSADSVPHNRTSSCRSSHKNKKWPTPKNSLCPIEEAPTSSDKKSK